MAPCVTQPLHIAVGEISLAYHERADIPVYMCLLGSTIAHECTLADAAPVDCLFFIIIADNFIKCAKVFGVWVIVAVVMFACDGL